MELPLSIATINSLQYIVNCTLKLNFLSVNCFHKVQSVYICMYERKMIIKSIKI